MPTNNATLTTGAIARRVALHGSAPERSHIVTSQDPEIPVTKTIETIVDEETGELRYEDTEIKSKAGP